jgi:peptidoglycan/xylan/chitin deacetylase (PgdA/CDA1 family)
MKEINLEWTPLEGARAYRLTVRDGETGDRLLQTDPLSEPRYAIDPSLVDGRDIEARLEARRDDADEEAWEEVGPTAPVPIPDGEENVTVLRWEGVSPVHRLVISDQTAGTKVLDRAVIGTSYPYALGRQERGHDLVMRVFAWRDGDWDEGTEWQPLPLQTMLGEPREAPPPLATDRDAGLLLVFSIDTEGFLARQQDPNPATTVDELIFGDFGNSENRGIGLHMDLLEHFGFRGCFFLDVLSAIQYGEEELKRAAEAILSRGHEVQLHLHDEHVRNSDDPAVRALAGDLNGKDRDEFRKILELAVEVFERLVGKRPIAYRAGGYRITDEHFPVLQELGIRFDSSVNAYFHSQVSDWMRTRTQPYWVGDVLELPVSWTMVRDDRDAPETRAFAPNATAGDPVSVMPASPTGVPRVATYVSHSLELMQADRQLSPDELADYERKARDRLRDEIAENVIKEVNAGPRLINGRLDDDLVYRMAGLLRRIADRDDARCVTFAELSEITDRFPRGRRREPVDPVPAIDRPHGAATVTGTRIYSDALLAQLDTSDPAKRRPSRSDDEAVTTLVNADVAWKGSRVAVIGEQSVGVSGWLERRGVAGVEHFEEPDSNSSGGFDVVAWPSGFERRPPGELADHLDAAANMLGEDGTLVLRVRTLGVAPRGESNGGPPLSELVFPAAAERSAESTAWDVATFSSWLEARGFRVVAERRVARTSAELKALDRFADKLESIPNRELQTGGVDFTLRRAPEPEPTAAEPEPDPAESETGGDPAGTDRSTAADELLSRFAVVAAGDAVVEIKPSEDGAAEIPMEDVTVTTATPGTLVEGALEPHSCDVIICHGTLERIEPERLADAARALYRVLRPGGQLLLRIAGDGAGIATETTILVSLLRAGLEMVAAESSGDVQFFRLLRPLELPDIVRFSGISA